MKKFKKHKKRIYGKDRRPGVINGYIEKNYIKSDVINLHVLIDDFGKRVNLSF